MDRKHKTGAAVASSIDSKAAAMPRMVHGPVEAIVGHGIGAAVASRCHNNQDTGCAYAHKESIQKHGFIFSA